jgi:hypothetical protein
LFHLHYLLGSCSNSNFSFLYYQVSKKHNQLLEQQLDFTHAEVNLNIKGKNLALLAQANDLQRKERLALHNFRSQLPYDTDDSEAEEMKELIIYEKKSVKEATGTLEEDTVPNSVPRSMATDLPSSNMVGSVASATASSSSDCPATSSSIDLPSIDA